MSSMVVVSGDFSSGTTALFTLFRQTGDFHCLYEPLHQKLLEYLTYPLRPDEHHRFVDPYFREYRGYAAIPDLFRPEWGLSDVRLAVDDSAPEFHRYWSYLMTTSLQRTDRVLVKDNRLAFRLGWIKNNFPGTTVVHVSREPLDQWNSIVRRTQEAVGREDVGQDRVDFAGFNVAQWCDALEPTCPELAARHSSTGFERFSKLWAATDAEQRRHADVSVQLTELSSDLTGSLHRIGVVIGYSFDAAALRRFVASDRLQADAPRRRDELLRRVDQVGRKYAKARVAGRYLRRGDTEAALATVKGRSGLPRRHFPPYAQG